MSGVFSGRPYSQDDNWYVPSRKFYARPFWSIVDSYADYNPLEAGRGLVIDREKSVLSYDSDGRAEVNAPGFKDYARLEAAGAVQAVREQMVMCKQSFILSGDLKSQLASAGCHIPLRSLGRVLPEYGLHYKRGNKQGNSGYILENNS